MQASLKFLVLFVFVTLNVAVAAASCLVQDNLELYDARLSTREAWAHCSLQDARLYNNFFETTLRGYVTIQSFKTVDPNLIAAIKLRGPQILKNREVMRKTLLPVSEGGEARRALLNIQSDYRDQVTGKEFSLSGFGTLVAVVDRLPNNRITPLNSKSRYLILTAAHLVQGENLRAIDNIGTKLTLGRTYFDDAADLAVIEIAADPLIQPLAYLSPNSGSQKLATYLEDINLVSEKTEDRFSGFSYAVTPTGSLGSRQNYATPGFFLGHFLEGKNDDSIFTYPLLRKNQDGSISIDRSVKAGLSGTPLIADIGSRYLSLIGVVTYSGANSESANGATTSASPERILKLLLKAARNQKADSNSRWIFVNGIPVHQSEQETKIFFDEKPIGNGIYVNGKLTGGPLASGASIPKLSPKLDPKLKFKLDLQLEPLKRSLPETTSPGPLDVPDRNKIISPDFSNSLKESVILRLHTEGINASKQ